MPILNTNILQLESGDEIFVYSADSSKPSAIYSDPELTTPISQPLVADSNGFIPEYFAEDKHYSIRVFNRFGVPKETREHVEPYTSYSQNLTKNILFAGSSDETIIDSTEKFVEMIPGVITDETGFIGSFQDKTDLDAIVGIDGQWGAVKDDDSGCYIMYWWNETTEEWVMRDINSKTTPSKLYRVRFMTPDGTIIKTEYLAKGKSAKVPDVPAFSSALTFTGWVGKYSNIVNDSDIVANYTPTDGWNHYGIRTISNDTSATIRVTKSSTATLSIDYGDGSTSATSLKGTISFTHTWANSGDYVIRITQSNNDPWCEGHNSTSLTFLSDNSLLRYVCFAPNRNTTTTGYLGLQAFYKQTILEYVLNPNDRSLDVDGFQLCKNLKFFVDTGSKNIPSGYLYSTGLESFWATNAFISSGSSNPLDKATFLQNVYTPLLSSTESSSFLGAASSLKSFYAPELTGTYIPSAATTLEEIDCGKLKKCGTASSMFNLTLVEFPVLTSVANTFLTNNRKIKTLSFPELLSTGTNFLQGSLMKSLILPKIVSFGNSPLMNCYSLEYLDLGPNITAIGASFLYNAYNMKTLIIRATTPPISTSPFTNCPDTMMIYVPSGSVALYKAASGWSTFASTIFPIP